MGNELGGHFDRRRSLFHQQSSSAANSHPNTINVNTNVHTTTITIPPTPRTSSEYHKLSDDFKHFLRSKQKEYEQLVHERDELKLDVMANQISYQAIIDTTVSNLQQLNQCHLYAIADSIAWKAIAMALTEIQKQEKKN